MATIKTGAVVAEIRGSLGGNVFSRNKGGAYVRQRVKPINPNTPKQAQVRGTFGTLQARWRSLTQAQQDTWKAAVANYTAVNRVGDTIQYTPLQLFTRCNMTLIEGGEAQIDEIQESPGSDVVVALKGGPHPWEVLNEAKIQTGTAVLYIPDGGPPASRIRIYASPVVSNGINSERSVSMRLIGHYEPGDITITGTEGVIDVLADWKAVFGDPNVVAGEGKIFMRADFYRANRGFSKPIGVQQVVFNDVTP